MAYTGKKPVDFVDVTETKDFTVTEDLTVDTDTLVVDSANDRVGVNVSPATALDVNGTINVRTSGYQFGRITTNNVDADNGGLSFQTISSGSFSERLRILPSGGITFNGDTAAANALDDYEEGTFTIGLNVSGGSPSFSISHTTAYYIKIGKLVHFNWYSGSISVTNGGSGNVSLTGLPFFSNSATNNYSTFQYLHGNAFSQTTTGGYVNTNANNAFFVIQNQTGANVGLQTGTRYIMVRGTYYSA